MRTLVELQPTTVDNSRSVMCRLWLRERAGFASPQDVKRRKMLEKLLGLRAKDIPAQGRPKVKP